MFLVALVSLSVCLFVCGQHYSKSYERIGMTLYGRVLSSTRTNWLNFGGDLGIVRWVNEQKNTVIVVAYPDSGAGNDPEPFFFLGGWVVFHNQGSTFLQWVIWEQWSASAKEVCALWVLLVLLSDQTQFGTFINFSSFLYFSDCNYSEIPILGCTVGLPFFTR